VCEWARGIEGQSKQKKRQKRAGIEETKEKKRKIYPGHLKDFNAAYALHLHLGASGALPRH
jgi:hypothetical protein